MTVDRHPLSHVDRTVRRLIAAEWGCLVPSQPAAFLSYARFNDQHDDGWVSQFCERLSAEVRVQLGEEFPIFQDRKDIAWGQSWQQRIDQALGTVTLLVVIITPGFFRSSACRAEVERFLARERDLGRDDLILPVYYVSTPELEDPERRDADELARVLRSRQFADWRELRFEPLDSPKARRAVALLAARMRDTFWQLPADRRMHYSESAGAVDDAAPAGMGRVRLRRDHIALLGPRASGKTTLATVLHRGELPRGLSPTVLHITIKVEEPLLKIVWRLLSDLISDARTRRFPHALTILDNPGLSRLPERTQYLTWLESAKMAKNVFYVVDVVQLSDRRYCDLAVNGARQIARWDLGDRRKLLVLTHTDLDPAWQRGDLDEIAARAAVKDLREGLHAEAVIMGAQNNDRGARDLAYRVLEFLAR